MSGEAPAGPPGPPGDAAAALRANAGLASTADPALPRGATAAILAGGQSRRFGSDKAQALFRGRPLAVHAALASSARFQEVLLIAKDPDKYLSLVAGLPCRLIRDVSPWQTPLAGLAAAFGEARFDLVFAFAADMPFAANSALIEALFAAIEGHDAAVPVSAGTAQPLCALWRRAACSAAASALLHDGNAGPRALFDLVRTARLDWPDPEPFRDADTPEALAVL